MCVKECPTKNFAYHVNSSISGSNWQNEMICKYGVHVADKADAEKRIAENKCAGYYLTSKPGESAVSSCSVRSFHKLR